MDSDDLEVTLIAPISEEVVAGLMRLPAKSDFHRQICSSLEEIGGFLLCKTVNLFE